MPFHSVPFPAERDGPPCGATCWRTPLTSAVLESCGAHPEKHLGKNTWRTTRSDWPPSLAPRWALNQGIGSTLDSAKLSQLLLSAYWTAGLPGASRSRNWEVTPERGHREQKWQNPREQRKPRSQPPCKQQLHAAVPCRLESTEMREHGIDNLRHCWTPAAPGAVQAAARTAALHPQAAGPSVLLRHPQAPQPQALQTNCWANQGSRYPDIFEHFPASFFSGLSWVCFRWKCCHLLQLCN